MITERAARPAGSVGKYSLIPLDHSAYGFVAGRGPNVLVEDLHLDKTVVSGSTGGLDQPAVVDMPIADVTAAEQRSGRQRGNPVRDLHQRDPIGRAGDLALHVRIP